MSADSHDIHELPLFRPRPRTTSFEVTKAPVPRMVFTPIAEKAKAHEGGKRTVKGVLYEILANNKRWYTLCELEAELTGRGFAALQTAISARLRELPKAYACRVNKRTRGESLHLWEYSIGVDGVTA